MLYEDAMEPSHLLQQKEVRIYFDNTIVVEGGKAIVSLFLWNAVLNLADCVYLIGLKLRSTTKFGSEVGMCSSNKVYKCNS